MTSPVAQTSHFDDWCPGNPDSSDPVSGFTPRELIAAALSLGAQEVVGWSQEEEDLAAEATSIPRTSVMALASAIRRGNDPLGETFCSIYRAQERRSRGATYTPSGIIRAMVNWAEGLGVPDRVIDPGSGSGRFLLQAGRRFKQSELIGIEVDPLASLLARANLATCGFGDRARIILGDYRSALIPPILGRSLFIGNPPYVRHHLIESRWKHWLTDEAARRGLDASQLAGLHVYFFLATVAKAKPGDFGTFITAAEWLDVNYGQLLRDLFLSDLGGSSITVIEPEALPFADAAATAAITTFEIGTRRRSVILKRASSLDELCRPGPAHEIRRERLEAERRWTHLTRPSRRRPAGYVELGELCRVHRGQVTGANRIWIAGPHSEDLPESVLYPSVTKARELFEAGVLLENTAGLRCVIDLPVDLDAFDIGDRRRVEQFLARARRLGADQGYIATTRKAWWSVGLRKPAPILATYMARRPPAFVRNRADARHINIAHGLYPREPLDELILLSLTSYLSNATTTADGRTYAGGLTKFEPREMERLMIPGPELLRQQLQ
jgi:adenine-specific DNA-methyltransferase